MEAENGQLRAALAAICQSVELLGASLGSSCAELMESCEALCRRSDDAIPETTARSEQQLALYLVLPTPVTLPPALRSKLTFVASP